MPPDPREWTAPHVRSWLRWACRQWALRPRPLARRFPLGPDLLALRGPELRRAARSARAARLLRRHLALLRLAVTGAPPSGSESEEDEPEPAKGELIITLFSQIMQHIGNTRL